MLNLKRYVPNGRVSTGLLVTWEGRQVWAAAPAKHWDVDGRTIIPLVGVGGGQEPGESLTEAVSREALEEARAEVRLRPARRITWVKPGGRVEQRDPARDADLAAELGGEPVPLMVWQQSITARCEDRSEYDLDYIVAVYQGEFLQDPEPGMEVPALVHVTEAQFLALLDRPAPLDGLAAQGARVVGSGLPDHVLVRLSGSALYLARHWDRLDRQQ
ncbi:MAG: hypothetical protein ACM3ZA_08255 [Bacillota bacterium]